MEFQTIRIGDKVEIREEGIGSKTYSSKVTGIIDPKNQLISIFVPVYAGQNLNMEEDTVYIIFIYTNQTLIKFRSRFEGYLKEEMNYFLTIKILGEGERMQRREFFRFTCMLAMRFSILDYENNEAARLLHEAGYTDLYNAVIRDIGGGGIRFITNKEMDLTYPIQCTIMLGTTTMVIKGKALEKQYMPKSGLKFQYRVVFLDISPSAQEEIVNYIFAEQRKQRKIVVPEAQ